MAIDIIARGMIEDFNSDISQLSEKVSNHTDDSDIHVTVSDKENWNSHPNDVQTSGNPVQLEGLQGGVPFNSVTLSGKNLIKYPYYDGESKTMNGVTFTVNSDGSVTANGTATGKTYFHLRYTTEHLDLGVIPNQTYTFKACPSGASSSTYNASMSVWNGEKFVRGLYDYGNGNTFTRDNTTTHYGCAIAIEAGVTVENLVFRPQLELGSSPTAYEPPITCRELTVNVCGKNLIPYPYYNGDSKTHNGITFTVNGDGTITANGTAENTAEFTVINKNTVVKKGTYCISGCPKNTVNGYIACGNDGVRLATDSDGSGGTFTVDNDANGFTFVIRINSGSTVEDLIFRPQLELGDTATAYEPYHGATYTITPDSNPYTVPVDIIQQDGINNISVSEGELSVSGVRKNEAIKRIWDKMSMDLLFDGITSANSPAVVDLANYKFVEICHIMIANEKTYPVNIRLSLDSYLSSASTISTPIVGSSINTIHTEEGTVSSLYAISATGSNMNNTKIYGIK